MQYFCIVHSLIEKEPGATGIVSMETSVVFIIMLLESTLGHKGFFFLLLKMKSMPG